MTNALHKFRVEKQLTQEALADALGVTKGMISKWERGEAVPRRQYLSAIFNFTGGAVTANDFMQIEAAE